MRRKTIKCLNCETAVPTANANRGHLMPEDGRSSPAHGGVAAVLVPIGCGGHPGRKLEVLCCFLSFGPWPCFVSFQCFVLFRNVTGFNDR